MIFEDETTTTKSSGMITDKTTHITISLEPTEKDSSEMSKDTTSSSKTLPNELPNMSKVTTMLTSIPNVLLCYFDLENVYKKILIVSGID